jgi:molecular chaperone DnaK (HSP70)
MVTLGVDFGTLKTVIAVARNRGVDVVRTAYSSTISGASLAFVHDGR